MPETWQYTNANNVTRTLAVDGVSTLPSGAKLVVQEQEGYGAPDAAVHTYKVPLLAGSVFVKARHGERVVTLRGVLVASSWSQLKAAQRDLAEVLDPTLGEGTLTVTRDDGVTRRLPCVARAGLGGIAGAQSWLTAPVVLEFLAAQPYWEATATTTVTYSGVGTGWTFPTTFPVTFTPTTRAVGAYATLTYEGTAPAAPVIVLEGPMTTPRLEHLESGRFFALLGDVPANATLTIDMRPESSGWKLSAYGTTYYEYPAIDPGSQLFDLVPGTNTLLIFNDGPRVGGTATVQYTARYVAL